MVGTLLLCFGLVAVTAGCAVVSRRIGIPHSILLVLTGLALAVVPGLPRVTLEPDYVMLLFLPPLLYSAGVGMSWQGFRNEIGQIGLLAVGCVLFTTGVVAWVAHSALGLSWATAFVLGAVVSPPDIIAPMAIARRLRVPKRVLVILEGEGLVNDATALVLFRLALAAAATGSFSAADAVGSFVAITLGELVYGVLVGRVALWVRHWVRDPDVEITLSLLTPFAAFWPPELIGGSGVLATVAAGLFVSWNGPRLISAGTRLQGVFIWRLVVYLIEALLFLITGLQARTVIERLRPADWDQLVLQAAVITGLVILIRFVWVYPTAYLSARLSRSAGLPWKATFAVAFTGIRGVVSLAAALSIPLVLPDGSPFPDRDTILFITFCVILSTLLGQGAVLPIVLRRIGLAGLGERETAADRHYEVAARIEAVAATLERLNELARTGAFSPDLLAGLRSRHVERLRRLEIHRETEGADAAMIEGGELERQLIAAERRRIEQLRRDGAISDEVRRRIERELDLEEARIVQAGHDPV